MTNRYGFTDEEIERANEDIMNKIKAVYPDAKPISKEELEKALEHSNKKLAPVLKALAAGPDEDVNL